MNETYKRSGIDAIPFRDRPHYMTFDEVSVPVKQLSVHVRNYYHIWSNKQEAG